MSITLPEWVGLHLLAGSRDLWQIECMTGLDLRFVVYREDELWVAHSLEMDLIGVGETTEEAIDELRGNMEAQLSFATSQRVNPFRAAPPEIQRLWDEGNLSALGLNAENSAAPEFPRVSQVISWTEAQVTHFVAGQFQRASA